MGDLPVIFLAFANELRVEDRYLRNLKKEENELADILRQAEDAGLCEVVSKYGATFDDIQRVLYDPKYTGRIAIFHFAGHSDPQNLSLLSSEGEQELVSIDLLAEHLGKQKGLKLAFLNGCDNGKYAQRILDKKVPAVVATSAVLDDFHALSFSRYFYKFLGSGDHTIADSFRLASQNFKEHILSKNEMEKYQTRWRDLVGDTGASRDFPWEIFGIDTPQARIGLRDFKKKKNVAGFDNFPRDFYLYIDRDEQNSVFENLYLQDARLPRICLLPGDNQCRHRSLAKRFINFLLKKNGPNVQVFWYLDEDEDERPIEWPPTPHKKVIQQRTFEAFGIDTTQEGINWENGEAIVRSIAPDSIAVGIVRVQLPKFQEDNLSLLEWYIKDFWNILVRKDEKDNRQLFLFLNFFTPDGFQRSKPSLLRFFKKDPLNSFMDRVEELCQSAPQEKVLFPILGDVTRTEVKLCIEEKIENKYPVTFTDFDDAFPPHTEQYKMEQVEEGIERVLKKLNII